MGRKKLERLNPFGRDYQLTQLMYFCSYNNNRGLKLFFLEFSTSNCGGGHLANIGRDKVDRAG